MNSKSKCPLSGIYCEDCGYQGDECFLTELICVLDAALEKIPDAGSEGDL